MISELWKQFTLTYLINQGHYDWWHFPFQLCSVPMYLCLFLPYIRNKTLQNIFLNFLMTFGLLGGIVAFFDTSGMHYAYFPLTIHSYLWHILLIVLGLYVGLHFTSLRTSHPLFFLTILLYVLCCLIATILNLTFFRYGTINLFYINPKLLMGQIVFRDIRPIIGNIPAILCYITATIIGALVFHLLWCLCPSKKD